jgi:16S rRNA (cytosine1402-N4)-methyltransferase
MKHETVLLKESVDALDVAPGKVIMDGTLGAGGHTREICKRLEGNGTVIAFDLDADAIAHGKTLIPENADVRFHQRNFRNLDSVLAEEHIGGVDGILLDLGYSSDQLETGGRGLSFQKDEPLKMTLAKEISESEFDAGDVVNSWDEEDIANIIYAYGEERFARRIAHEIVEAREKKRIETTAELVSVIESAVPFYYRNGRINAATKTFQALRITVNDELESLKIALDKGLAALKSGGRYAIITFHSLEDRIVKNFFRDQERAGVVELLTKKPITPSDEEIKKNPRSRSAQLRVIKKI